MISREEIMDKLIDASLNSSPKSSIDFEIDGTTWTGDALDELIVKILRTHEGTREVHIKVKM